MMLSMTDYSFGDVLLVPFPFTDQSTSKKRPAIVINSAAYQQHKPDLIIMAITSQFKPAQGIGEFAIQAWQQAGLLKPSVVKPVITTIEKALVIKTLGRFQNDDLQSLRKTIAKIIG